MKNKSALITGSTSGIGLAIAHCFAGQGMNIGLHGLLPEEEGKALANEFEEQYQCKAAFSNADLRNVDEIKSLVQEANGALNGIDILVNNAGIQHTSPVEEFPLDKWNDIIAINLSAAFHASQHVLPLMRANKWGRIINIASVHGLVASKLKAGYVTAKHGLVGLTKVIALENAECGITCNAICPGWVDTPLIARQIEQIAENENIEWDAARYNLLTEKQPMPEMTTTENLSQLALFLCSDAAKTMTGASIPLDGGWTAQ